MAQTRIVAEGVVAAQPHEVFAFLSDLRNHWRLENRFTELDAIDSDGRGGRVRMVGPWGLGRVATTRVVAAHADTAVHGSAELSGGTRAAVRWDIGPHERGSCVTLSATIERASAFDRALLALGARRWLERLFASAVRRLDETLRN